MSTNFFLVPPQCPCCGHQDKSIHLGKSSVGWTFGLRIRPDDNINNWNDIVSLIKEKQADYWQIQDEYGTPFSFAQFSYVVCERQGKRASFSPSWLAQNYAMEGPNNLVRRLIDGQHCVGHGDGTYDYLVGSFR